MLAAQMAATHNAIMTFARRLNHADTIPQQDSAERAFNKLARTFTAQVEALKRYRSASEQTVRVEHVTVNEGGHQHFENFCLRVSHLEVLFFDKICSANCDETQEFAYLALRNASPRVACDP
jgi:hypothetical protein